MSTNAFDTDNAPQPSAWAVRDWGLVQAALAGSEPAYALLVKYYRNSLYHLILRMVGQRDDAEDLTMEVLAKAFRNLASYHPGFAFSTWLFRIATNHCIDFIRRKRLRTQSLQAPITSGGEEFAWDVADRHTPDPQEAIIRRQRIEFVQQLVTRLPAKYEKMVRLRYFEELSYVEIAAELQVPLSTVKGQLFRARELLAGLLEGSQDQ